MSSQASHDSIANHSAGDDNAVGVNGDHQNDSVVEVARRLVSWFDPGHYVIALSGGVDSAVVAQAAFLSERSCVAVTAHSPSVASRESEDARRVVDKIGITHEVIETSEILDSSYVKNDARRCYHCKSHLFESIRQQFPDSIIITGTNRDDLGDYRPGLDAARESEVRAPLAELGIGKDTVRELAAHWQLPIAEKPASPCLASRLAYGVEVTPERLRRVEQAEVLLAELGLAECRVRLHAGELARIEVPVHAVAKLATPEVREPLTEQLRGLGFHFVTLDLSGFQSGSLNRLVQIEPSKPQ